MKNLVFASMLLLFISACQSDKSSEQSNTAAGIHTAVVKEVIQSSEYTYLHVQEGNAEKWLAVPKMQASAGETYYYKDGLPMNGFESKELNRTFDEILFLDNINSDQALVEKETGGPTASPGMSGAEPGGMFDNADGQTSLEPHAVVAEEVLQTTQYTYIRVKEGSEEKWIAVAKMEAVKGTKYYFVGGLLMTDFPSKELNRTFKEILFVDKISLEPMSAEDPMQANAQSNAMASKGSAIDLEKKKISMKHSKDDITIAKLLENKKEYNGKVIRVKGEVIKYSPGILKMNWIHLQDGTDFGGKFDLTITTSQEVKVGDNVTLEGIISLDKDFGFGYFYEVIMEDARLVN